MQIRHGVNVSVYSLQHLSELILNGCQKYPRIYFMIAFLMTSGKIILSIQFVCT